MLPTRRDTLILGAALPLLAGGVASAEAAGPPERKQAIRIFRIYADAAGHSHIEQVVVASARKELPVASVLAVGYAKAVEDWHRAPFKTFTINTSGRIEVELSDGTRQAIGPGDLVYLEDIAGKGHLTRLLTDGANLFLRMPDDFDLLAWARE